MLSNQILQNSLEGLKAITRVDLCVTDTEGKTCQSGGNGWRTFCSIAEWPDGTAKHRRDSYGNALVEIGKEHDYF